MILSELIDRLQEFQDAYEDEESHIEVKIALQPSWPMMSDIEDVVLVDHALDSDEDPDPVAVYIACGSGQEYLDSAAKQELSW